MEVVKKYYSLDEVQKLTKLSKPNIIHMGATGQLDIYVIAISWLVNFCGINTEDITSGHDRINLEVISASPYRISGPLKLYSESLARFETNPNAKVSRFIATPPGDMDHDHERYEYQLCSVLNSSDDQKRLSLSDCDFAVLHEDLERLGASMSKSTVGETVDEEPLSTKERKTLHLMIAALASTSITDISRSSKAAASIETAIALLGGDRKARGIEDHLKAVMTTLEEFKKKKPPP